MHWGLQIEVFEKQWLLAAEAARPAKNRGCSRVIQRPQLQNAKCKMNAGSAGVLPLSKFEFCNFQSPVPPVSTLFLGITFRWE
jgi:hypothetical protein